MVILRVMVVGRIVEGVLLNLVFERCEVVDERGNVCVIIGRCFFLVLWWRWCVVGRFLCFVCRWCLFVDYGCMVEIDCIWFV